MIMWCSTLYLFPEIKFGWTRFFSPSSKLISWSFQRKHWRCRSHWRFGDLGEICIVLGPTSEQHLTHRCMLFESWPHLTNTEHGMKPFKAKERTNTSVSSDVIMTALYPAAAAWDAWSNILVLASSCVDLSSSFVVAPVKDNYFLAVFLCGYKNYLSSKPMHLHLSFCHSSEMNLIKSDLFLALDRNFHHWCILWSALMYLNSWPVSEPRFSRWAFLIELSG